MRNALLLAVLAAASLPASAQTSASYKLEEHVFNAGGDPAGGGAPASASHRVTLDAIGDNAAGLGLSSASYRMDAGFGTGYPPPGEVEGLRFTGPATLVWSPEKAVGVYNLYRDGLSSLPGLAYGDCEQSGLMGETATDSETPAAGAGFFFLVTAENRLGEEGTKGTDSSSGERPNPDPCP